MSFGTLVKRNPTDFSLSREFLTVKIGESGLATQIRVKRGSDSVVYERTNRGAPDLFHPDRGDYSSLFSTLGDFARIFSGQRILDLGCGNGRLVTELGQIGLSATGMDLYFDPALPRAANLICGDAFATGLPQDGLDLLLSSYSVFHYEPIPRLRALLSESMRILRPGGRLLLAPIRESHRLDHLRQICGKAGHSLWQARRNGALQILKIPFGKPPRLP